MEFLDFYNHNLDKYVTNKEYTQHFISQGYDSIFNNYDNSKNYNILEIGVYEGQSISLLSDYFSNSFVTGIENNLENLKIPLKGRNYEILNKDAYCMDTLNYFDFKFDIIIDDGSHKPEHMEFCVSEYYKILNEGGILIVEDIIPQFSDLFIEKYTNCSVIDLRKLGREDSQLLLRRL